MRQLLYLSKYKSMSTLKVIVKKTNGSIRVNKDNEATIYIKYTHNNNHFLINTGVRIPPDQWCGDKNQSYPVKGPGRTTKNELIVLARQKVERAIAELSYSNQDLSLDNVKNYLSKAEQEQVELDMFQLWDKYIEHSNDIKAEDTVQQIERSKNNVVEFCKYKRISPTLDKINLDFYNDYVKYLIKKREMSNNTIGKEVKTLKAFLNYLKDRGYPVSEEVKKFKVFKEKPLIVYLTQDELKALYEYDFSKNKRLEKARDLFVLQASTGLRWSDLSRLDKEHIHGNIISMKAYKNKKQTLVPLIPRSEAILQKYEYQIPKLSEQNLNLYIKEACKIVDIDQPIEKAVYVGGKKSFTKVPKYQEVSTHVAVKTFITHCGEKGISAKVVSEITGKTVKVILDAYYGIDQKTIVSEMARAFGE